MYMHTHTGQARVDGIVCDIREEEKIAYLQRVNDAGVSNIEMECTAMASLCAMTGVKCAVVCVTLLDRLQGDQVRWGVCIPYAGYK
jgi:uridine phosphorylase